MPTLYTVNEVALLLDVTRMTVYRLCRDKELPFIRVGSQFRFTAVALRKRLSLGPNDEIVIPAKKKPWRKAVKA